MSPKRFFCALLTLILSLQFSIQPLAQANEISDLNDFIEIAESSPAQTWTEQKTELLNRLTQQYAAVSAAPLNEQETFIPKYLKLLDQNQTQRTRLVLNTLRPKKFERYYEKLKASDSTVDREALAVSLRSSVEEKQFRAEKQELATFMGQFHDEGSMLKNLIQHVSQHESQGPGLVKVMKVFVIALFIAILIAGIYTGGIIMLASIGAILEGGAVIVLAGIFFAGFDGFWIYKFYKPVFPLFKDGEFKRYFRK